MVFQGSGRKFEFTLFKGEIVMKKLLVLLLILGFATIASAATMNLSLKSPQDLNSDGTVTVGPGKEVAIDGNITVNLVSDMITIGVSKIDFNGGTWATIAAVGAWQQGTTTNIPGTLGTNSITRAEATAAAGTKWAANAILYSFTAVATGNAGTISIGMLSTDKVTDGSTPGKNYMTGSTTNILALHNLFVTPEPMTMSLLALGGLAVLRRRHA